MTSMTFINAHLPDHRFETRKPLFFTNFCEKMHAYVFSVNILVEIKKMHLEQIMVTFHRRALAEAGNAINQHISCHAHAHRKYSVQRTLAALERDVSRRIAQLPAKLLPTDYPSTDGVWPTQQYPRALEITRTQCRPHRRAADAVAVEAEGVHARDLKALGISRRLQTLVIPRPFPAVAKIVTDDHTPDAQSPDQNLIRENVRLKSCEKRIKSQTQELIHPGAAQGAHFLGKTSKTRRSRSERKMLRRRWLEYDDRGNAALPPRLPHHPGNDCLVTTVDAVEIADGRRASAMSGAHVVQAADQFHGRVAQKAQIIRERAALAHADALAAIR